MEPSRPVSDAAPLAVIDIGSNSGRVVVYRVEADGGVRIQATTRAALRLVREVDEGHALSAEAIERTLDALRDFRAISAGAGAQRSVAVATAALRDAENAPALSSGSAPSWASTSRSSPANRRPGTASWER